MGTHKKTVNNGVRYKEEECFARGRAEDRLARERDKIAVVLDVLLTIRVDDGPSWTISSPSLAVGHSI